MTTTRLTLGLKIIALAGLLAVVSSAVAGSRGFPSQLSRIDVSSGPTFTRVVLHLDATTEYRTAEVPAPPRWYVDLRNTRLAPGFERRFLSAEGPWVNFVRVAEDGLGNTRVVFDLHSSEVPQPSVTARYPSLVIEWPSEASDNRATVPETDTVSAGKPANETLVEQVDSPSRYRSEAIVADSTPTRFDFLTLARVGAPPKTTALDRLATTAPPMPARPPDTSRVLFAAAARLPETLVAPAPQRFEMPVADGGDVFRDGREFLRPVTASPLIVGEPMNPTEVLPHVLLAAAKLPETFVTPAPRRFEMPVAHRGNVFQGGGEFLRPVTASPLIPGEPTYTTEVLLASAPPLPAPIAPVKQQETPPGRRVRMPLAHLSVGQRIKIEGEEFKGKKFVAKEIELVESDDDDFEIEGPVSKLNLEKGRFSIGPFRVRTDEKTRVLNRKREMLAMADVTNRVRVKVQAKRVKDGFIRARSVRIDPESRDDDIEVEAPIEAISLPKSEFSVRPTFVSVTGGTEFKNFGFVTASNYAEDGKVARYIRRDDDEQHPDPVRIGPVYVGGRTQFGFEQSRNLDLERDDPDADDWYRTGGQVEVAAPLREYSEVYAKFNFARGFYRGNDPLERSGGDVAFREGFVYLGNFLHRSLGLQVGRQRFRDKREWLFDDRLDAVRLHVTRRRFRAEMSVAKSIFSQSNAREDQLYLIGYSQYRFPGRRYLAGYFVKRNDTSRRDEDPIWFGLSSRGRITRKLDYWAELSQMRGRRRNRLLRGHAFDIGGSYQLPLPWGSTISAGYAFGSGDRNFKDGVDGNFRQTRLNDNSYRYNGLKRYRYYGVLLEPELYNMKIATLDYGIRPSDDWSLNVAYHTYRQVVANDDLGDLELNIEPTGRDPRLGKEVDFVITLRWFRNIDINVLMGVFFPGPAFKGGPPAAFVFRPGIRYYF